MKAMSKKMRLFAGLAIVAVVCCVCLATGIMQIDDLWVAASLGGVGIATVLDDELVALTAQVKANTDAEDAAGLILADIPNRIKTAVDAALALGATTAQLQQVTDLMNGLKSHADPLAAAVVANTPAA